MYQHCSDCQHDCRKELLAKIKPYGSTLFIKRLREKELLGCVERNEKAGIIYHCKGITGGYDWPSWLRSNMLILNFSSVLEISAIPWYFAATFLILVSPVPSSIVLGVQVLADSIIKKRP